MQEPIERFPIEGGISISKADAAERQLRTAIWLWFHEFDPVPVIGLVSASNKILWKLHEANKTGFVSLRQKMLDRVVEGRQKDFIAIMNETENFIKHADRDPFEIHSFTPRVIPILLIDTVSSLQALNGSFSLEARAFQAWFLLHHPEMLKIEPGDPLADAIDKARPAINASKPDFYKAIALATNNALEQAASRPHP